jgi:hypothetical protein
MTALSNSKDNKLYEDLFWSFCHGLTEIVEDMEPDEDFGRKVDLEKYNLEVETPHKEWNNLNLEYRTDEEMVVTVRTNDVSMSPAFLTGLDKSALPIFLRFLRDNLEERYNVNFDIDDSIDIFESRVVEMGNDISDLRELVEFGEEGELREALGIPVSLDNLSEDSDIRRFLDSDTEFEFGAKNSLGTKAYVAYSDQDKDTYYIVGEAEDEDIFIHPVRDDDSRNKEDVNTIRRWLGYDYDFDEYQEVTGNKFPREGDSIRVQGDMKLTKTMDITGPEHAAEIVYKLQRQLNKLDIDEGVIGNNFKFRFYSDGTLNSVNLLPNISEEDVKENKGISVRSREGELSSNLESLVSTKIQTINDEMLAKIDNPSMEIFSKCEQVNQNPEDVPKTALQIDNHMVVCNNAYECPYSGNSEEPISIIVPVETSFNMIHDEHGEEVITLDPGRYEIGLLDRV